MGSRELKAVCALAPETLELLKVAMADLKLRHSADPIRLVTSAATKPVPP